MRQPRQSVTIDGIELQWLGPSTATQRRMRVSPTTNVIALTDGNGVPSDIVEFRRNFTIVNVSSETDSGPYKCILLRGGTTRETDITIRIYPSHQRSHIIFPPHRNVVVVNLTTPVIPEDEADDREQHERERTSFFGTYLPKTARFTVPLDIHPLPPTLLQWKKADRILSRQQQQQDVTISSDGTSRKYSTSHSVDYSQSFLKINDIRTIADSGNFSLFVETNGPLKKATHFQLVVNAVPVVWPLQIDNDQTNSNATWSASIKAPGSDPEYFIALYNVKVSPRVVCRASGHPRPTVTWYAHDCSSPSAEVCMTSASFLTGNDAWRKVDQNEYNNTATDYGISSTVYIPPGGRPVWFRCVADNLLSNSSDALCQQRLLALPASSDEQLSSFLSAQLTVSPVEPLVDDENVTIKCRASKMLYDKVELTVRPMAHSGARNVTKTWLPDEDDEYVVSDNLQLQGLGVNTTVFADCVFHPVNPR